MGQVSLLPVPTLESQNIADRGDHFWHGLNVTDCWSPGMLRKVFVSLLSPATSLVGKSQVQMKKSKNL